MHIFTDNLNTTELKKHLGSNEHFTALKYTATQNVLLSPLQNGRQR